MKLDLPAENDDANPPEDIEVLIDQIADEFLAAGRTNDPPTIDAFVATHPKVVEQPSIEQPLRRMLETIRVFDRFAETYKSSGETVPGPEADRPKIADYQIHRVAGRGGMGVVYEATQLSLSRKVALKVLPEQLFGNPNAIARFQLEARSAAQLHHTNIVPVFEVGNDGRYCFYAMQFIEGNALDEVIRQLREIRDQDESRSRHGLPEDSRRTLRGRSLETGTALKLTSECSATVDSATVSGKQQTERMIGSGDTVEDSRSHSSITASGQTKPFFRNVARIGRQVADGLQHAHERGIVHRDIKPSNIILDPESVAWITDFGLAKTVDVDLTRDGDVVGTLRYMSPERFAGTCDASSDVYSLGVTLYEMLALQSPFAGQDRVSLITAIRDTRPPTLRSLNQRVPRDLQTIVDKAMEKESRRRYRTAAEMAEDLERFLDGRPIRARHVGPAERLWLWSKSNVGLAASIVAIAILLVVGTSVSTWQAVRAGNAERQAIIDAARAIRAEDQAIEDRELARKALAKSQLDLAEKEFERGKYAEAEKIINDTPEQFRDASWNFLRDHARDYTAQIIAPNQGSVYDMQFLPRSQCIAIRCYSNVIGIFTLTGQQVGEWIPVHKFWSAFGVNGDGSKIAYPISADEVAVHDLVAGKFISWSWEGKTITDVVMSPDGESVLVTDDEQLTAHASDTGKPRWTQPHHGVLPAFSPDNRTVAVVAVRDGPDIRVAIRDVNDGTIQGTLEAAADDPNKTMLQFTQDGKRLACLGGEEAIQWDVAKKKKVRGLHFPGEVVQKFSPDGAAVATTSGHRIRLWDTATGRLLRSLNGASTDISRVTFSSDGSMLLSSHAAARNGIVDVWLTRLAEHVASIDTGKAISEVAFDLPGTMLYTIAENVLQAWDVASSAEKWHYRSVIDGGILTLAIHPKDGSAMLSEVHKPTLTHIASSGREPADFGTSHYSSIQFSQLGNRLLTVDAALAQRDAGGDARVFNYPQGDELWRLEKQSMPLSAFCLEDTAVALAGLTGGIELWDWKANKLLRTIDAAETGTINCVGASPDGRLLATGGPDRWIRVWKSETGGLVTAFRAHWEGVTCLKFNHDGREILSGSDLGVVRIHDAKTGEQKLALYGLKYSVDGLACNSDGSMIAAMAKEDCVVWDREISNRAAQFPHRMLTPASSPTVIDASADPKAASTVELTPFEKACAAQDWATASKAAFETLKLQPEDRPSWIRASATAALANDDELYREVCEFLLPRFGKTNDAALAETLCKACLLKGDLIKLAGLPDKVFVNELDAGNTHRNSLTWRFSTRALLELRRGNTDLATQYSKRSRQYGSHITVQAINIALQALIAKHESQPARFEELLAKLNSVLDQLRAEVEPSAHDYLVVELLRREAVGSDELVDRSPRSSNPDVPDSDLIKTDIDAG